MPENHDLRYSIHVDTLVHAPVREVWALLVDQERLGVLFWRSMVESDFRVGSPIVWKGTWEGKPFEDTGQILKREEGELFQYSNWSPTSGTPDEMAWWNILTFRLSEEKDGVRVVFLQGAFGTNVATAPGADEGNA
jgi:uncharacterized protein YndB with AHSA1/START domain